MSLWISLIVAQAKTVRTLDQPSRPRSHLAPNNKPDSLAWISLDKHLKRIVQLSSLFLGFNYLHVSTHLDIFGNVRFHFGPTHFRYHSRGHHTALNIHRAIERQSKESDWLAFCLFNIFFCHANLCALCKYLPTSKHLNPHREIRNRQFYPCTRLDRVRCHSLFVHNMCPHSIRGFRWLYNPGKCSGRFVLHSNSLRCPSSHLKSWWPPHKCQRYSVSDHIAIYRALNR